MLDELTRRAPHDYRAWALLGNHCLNTATPAASDTERWRRAEEAYARASALAPGAAPLWFNVALCHEIQSRYQAARRSWQHALTAESMEGAELLLELAADRFWIRWQESLVAGRPLHDLLCAEAHVRMAHVSAALSDTPDAQRHLEAAQRLDPLNLSGVPLQAELLWATGRRGDAVALLRGALPEFPFNRAYRKRLCTMLLESGDTSAAEGLARETLRIFQTRVPPADVAP